MFDRTDDARSERHTAPSLLIGGQRRAPSVVPFPHRSILLGRHPGCLVRLNHPDVSLRHALAIDFRPGVFLLDLHSRTGIRWQSVCRSGGWLNAPGAARIAEFTVGVADSSTGRHPPDPTRGFLEDLEDIPEVELAFVDGPLAGTRYHLKRAITLIGRSPRCKVRLRDDADISQVHACLLLDEQGLHLIDTLSRCGTLVNGQPARHACLEEGQRVRIGKHVLEVIRCRRRGFGDIAVPDLDPVGRSLHPERELVQSFRALRNLPEPERGAPVDRLLAAGRISPWQSRKIRTRNPTRLILDDRYLMMEPVGRGATSTVYRAFDLETDETVALKMPKTRDSDGVRRFARFRREISLSAMLRHPHIVAMRGTGRRERFLVFDFVRGKPLHRFLGRPCAQDPVPVVQWFAEMADALAYADAQGVIHRDIKPENIMITEENSAMLLDLGLACLSSGAENDVSPGLTRIGFAVGTPSYMSPEQAAGSSDIDCRADLYSLGCTIYAVLSGGPPFRTRNLVELARQHLTAPPPAIPELDGDLAHILDRALAKRPADRFQTPGELRDALRDWLDTKAAGDRLGVRSDLHAIRDSTL